MSRRPARLAAFTLLAGLAGACAPARETAQPAADELRTRVPAAWRFPLSAPAAFGEHGMVATDAALATRVGIEVLRAGGNAVDAAVATAFALAVVLPDAGNIGGGGFIVLHTQDGTEAALDFREAAPLAAHRDMYLDENGEVVPERSRTGHRAAGVPGAVAGLYEAHRRFGSRPWAELLAPAIRLADDGFPADSVFVAGIRADSQRLARFPASAALFLSRGRPPEPGSVWRNPDLAAALRRIAQHGPAGFYSGETAELIVAEMRRGGGLITHEDLARYRARWREPVVYHYRGHRVLSMPPPSSGGLTAALIANIVEGYDLHVLGWHSPEALHLIAEAMRRGFADRNQFLGDPDFAPIPPTFLDEAYAARQRATISAERATPSAEIAPGLAAVPAGTHTTHFSVVDGSGNVVALTTTINDSYGSAVTVAGGGFLLNDEMDDFTTKVGAPNMFDLVQGEANAIQPGKRMLSAMTPTIVFDPDGQPLLITGAAGGPRIITTAFQILSNVVDYGMDVATAVSAPRIHHQHLPDILYYEPDGLLPDQIAGLERRGHVVQRRRGTIGVAPSIVRGESGWWGFADPRQGLGTAEGY